VFLLRADAKVDPARTCNTISDMIEADLAMIVNRRRAMTATKWRVGVRAAAIGII